MADQFSKNKVQDYSEFAFVMLKEKVHVVSIQIEKCPNVFGLMAPK